VSERTSVQCAPVHACRLWDWHPQERARLQASVCVCVPPLLVAACFNRNRKRTLANAPARVRLLREQLEKARRVAVPDIAVEREKRMQKLVQEVILREDAMWGCVPLGVQHVEWTFVCERGETFSVWGGVDACVWGGGGWTIVCGEGWGRFVVLGTVYCFCCSLGRCGAPGAVPPPLLPAADWKWPPEPPRFAGSLAWLTSRASWRTGLGPCGPRPRQRFGWAPPSCCPLPSCRPLPSFLCSVGLPPPEPQHPCRPHFRMCSRSWAAEEPAAAVVQCAKCVCVCALVL
jgi:hypothetical protein